MIRSSLRILAALPLLIGIATLIGDTTRSVFEGRPLLLSFGDFLAVNLPDTLFALKAWFDATLPENAWIAFEQSILNLPGTPLFLGIATLLFFLGSQKAPRKTLRS